MAIDPLARQRRLLLPIALLLAGSAALAGGLTVSLVSRHRVAPPAPALAATASAAGDCAATPTTLTEPDPMAVLAAALGEARGPAMAGPQGRPAAAPLDGLLASPQATPAAAPPVAPDAPASPPADTAPAATPPAALTAPPIAAGYRLDLGYFLAPDQAVAFATQVQDRGVPVQLIALPDASGRVWTHVRTPPFAGSAQALRRCRADRACARHLHQARRPRPHPPNRCRSSRAMMLTRRPLWILLPLLAGCGTDALFRRNTRVSSIAISVVEDANDNAPVALDLVYVAPRQPLPEQYWRADRQ